MLKERCQQIANEAGLGKIIFTEKYSSATGREFYVGHIIDSLGKKDLFCKSNIFHSDCFFLCNDYENLSPEESKASREW
jgi:hypothetical protein